MTPGLSRATLPGVTVGSSAMLSMLIAALFQGAPAAAQPALPPPKVVSPLTITAQPKAPPPADVTVPISGTDDDLDPQSVTIYPRAAWHRGTGGQATLTCLIDAHGLAERCRIAWESPQGQGFGAAALERQPLIRVPPKTGADGRPIAAEMNLAFVFTPPESGNNIQSLAGSAKPGSFESIDASNLQIRKNAKETREVVMMNAPTWTSAASFDDLAAAYPAKAGGAEGYVVVHCEVTRSSGRLNRCVAAHEEPTGKSFAPAALKLAAKFRVDHASLATAPHGAPVEVDVPIRFMPPKELAERRVTAPRWLSGLDPEKAPKLFPPEAAEKGLTSGRGVAHCKVMTDGTLAACTPAPGDPDGLGFSEAAVRLAGTLRMNLWSADAAPVEGGTVDVPIRLKLAGTQ